MLKRKENTQRKSNKKKIHIFVTKFSSSRELTYAKIPVNKNVHALLFIYWQYCILYEDSETMTTTTSNSGGGGGHNPHGGQQTIDNVQCK